VNDAVAACAAPAAFAYTFTHYLYTSCAFRTGGQRSLLLRLGSLAAFPAGVLALLGKHI